MSDKEKGKTTTKKKAKSKKKTEKGDQNQETKGETSSGVLITEPPNKKKQ